MDSTSPVVAGTVGQSRDPRGHTTTFRRNLVDRLFAVRSGANPFALGNGSHEGTHDRYRYRGSRLPLATGHGRPS